MSGEHLTDLATSWTTIRNAHTPGPVGQAAMHELIGRYHDAVERLIIDHFRVKKLQPLPPGDLLDDSRPDADYDRVWSEAVLNRTWSRLETYEVNTPKNRYHTVLQLRRAQPKAAIDELAEELGRRTGTKVSPEAFRKTLQRARNKFAELLVQELRETIHPCEPEDIEQEIFALGLGHLYRRYSEAADH
jgi:RNA polymerase sigma-70 factor (ECF subfamily)